MRATTADTLTLHPLLSLLRAFTVIVLLLLTVGKAFAATTGYVRPVIDSFSPANGVPGTVVTVNGSGFSGLTSVRVGSVNSTYTLVSSSSLKLTVPATAVSSKIKLANPGYSAASSAVFTVNSIQTFPQPMITSQVPAQGSPGTAVTITGMGFTGTTSVWLGNDHNLPFTLVSDTEIRATVTATSTTSGFAVVNPQHAAFSPVPFIVTGGSQTTPTVASFSPSSGPVGTLVTVTGSNFTGATGVTIGSSAQAAVSSVTTSSLSFVVPADASSGSIKVFKAGVSGSSSSSFTVTVPVVLPDISSFSPASGPIGTVITVTGSGFSSAISASVGGAAPVPVTVASSTSLSFVVPAGAATGAVQVVNASGSDTSSAAFTVTVTTEPPPGGPIGQVAASRLLTQGTFGSTPSSIDAAAAQSYDAWFAAQAAATRSLTLPNVPNKDTSWLPYWWRNVVTGPDQLRQRMAFALSEILVVSDQSGTIVNHNETMAAYYDILVNNALGNYRTLLERVTLSPTMGLFLNMFRNNKENLATGVHADQNYAREVMQLFTIGLVKLNQDGTVQKDVNGVPIPTYDQADVEGMASVLTGWASNPVNNTGENAWIYDVDYINPMVAYENHHDTNAKTIVGGVRVPAGGTAAADLKIALDTLFNHPNVGPFISLRLIQRMVTSNPSPAYVSRVSAAFNNNGSGVRGDLLAVAKAILTDPEAVAPGDNTAGKLREPLLRLTHLWRAFSAADSTGNLAEYSVLQMSSQNFAESVLSSPSVFNFFAPDYQRSGNMSLADMVAPEFQITNENTLVLTGNMLQRAAYQYVDSRGVRYAGPNGYSETYGLSSSSVMLKTAAWEAYAATPASLVDRLNTVFMQGLMPAAMRTTLINYVTAIPASLPAARVIEATDLLINSPQYAVQR